MRRMMIGCISSIALDSRTHLLMHMDGTNGSNVYVDSSLYARTISVTGNAVQSTARYKFGSASTLHDGDADYLSISGINFGTGAFCIELWMYLTSNSTTDYVLSYGGSNEASTAGFGVRVSTTLGLYASANLITGSAVSLNTWHHLAIVGNGGADGNRNIKMYLDGSQVGSTYAVNYNYTGKTLIIGANEDSTSQCIFGNTDEVRVSVGTERYTGNFTVPTDPFYT